MKNFRLQKFPLTRIATFDISAIARQKHHVVGMIELDVTLAREKIKELRRQGRKISLTAWLIKVAAMTLKDHENVASFLKGKRHIIIFDSIDVSVALEKEVDGQRVPIPLVIKQANEKSPEAITTEIIEARQVQLSGEEIVMNRSASPLEKFYYCLPGFIRRLIWKIMLKYPKFLFEKMGNVAFTSVMVAGKMNGWFIPLSVHPICFGVSSIASKAVVENNEIMIRQILNMTVLMDHDVVDGMTMAKFISDFTGRIKEGIFL